MDDHRLDNRLVSPVNSLVNDMPTPVWEHESTGQGQRSQTKKAKGLKQIYQSSGTSTSWLVIVEIKVTTDNI